MSTKERIIDTSGIISSNLVCDKSSEKTIDPTDKDALRMFCMEELATIVQRNRGALGGVGAIRELLDRIDGKPGQTMTVAANISITNLVQELDGRSSGLPKIEG